MVRLSDRFKIAVDLPMYKTWRCMIERFCITLSKRTMGDIDDEESFDISVLDQDEMKTIDVDVLDDHRKSGVFGNRKYHGLNQGHVVRVVKFVEGLVGKSTVVEKRESSCRGCGRMNDDGVDSCWWCGCRP